MDMLRRLKNMTLEEAFREDKARAEKWKFLTEGIDDDYRRVCTEIMLENMSDKSAHENISSSAFPAFVTRALPIIRRTFPDSFIFDLVGVQPMPMPAWMVFWFNQTYGTAKAPTAVGDRVDLLPNKTYAGGRRENYLVGTGDGSTTQFDLPDGGIIAGSLKVYTDGKLLDGCDPSIPLTSGYTLRSGYGTGGVDALVFATAPAEDVEIYVTYDSQEECGDVREMNIEICSQMVEAESQKLKTSFCVEAGQNLQSYYGLSMDAETTALIAEEMERERQQLIIEHLLMAAGAGNTNWSQTPPAGDVTTWEIRQYRKTLYEAIVDSNNLIYNRRYRNATWIIGHTDAIARLQKLEEFKLSDEVNPNRKAIGRQFMGTLNNRWNVYVDPWFPDANKLLLGYKGTDPRDTGYVYAPYILFTASDRITDPDDFRTRKGAMARYAKKMTVPEMFSTVTITA